MAPRGGTRANRPGGTGTDGSAARRGVVLVLAVLLPLAFTTSSFDTVFLHKYTVLVLGALVLLPLVAVRVAEDRSPRHLANGLHWPVLALVAWTAVTTATSLSPRLSVLGYPRSFDGLVSAAAMALVFFVVAADGTAYARRLATVVVVAGAVVVAYGLVQLYDHRLGGNLDPFDWQNSPFRGTGAIWSTFGNPNHLAGFVTMLFPLVAVLFVLRRDPRWRWGLGALAVASVVTVVATKSQGAFLATGTGLFTTALLAGVVRGRLRGALAAGSAALAVVAFVVLSLSPGGGLPGRLIDPIDVDGKLGERSDLWRAGWEMALDRPLVGVGPDMYRVPFHRYQVPRYVALNGPSSIPNGPHNLFVNTLATQGFPGLALLLLVLGVAALRVVGAVRRLEQETASRPARGHPGVEARLLLAGTGGAVVTYLTEGSFNANVLPLTALAWMLLGLAVALTVRAGVPVTLRPRRLLGVAVADDEEAPARAARRPSRARPSSVPGAVGIAAAVVALVLAWPATAPWRADRQLWDVWPLAGELVGLAERGQADQARAAAGQVLPRFRAVVRTNPLDPTYHSDLAELHFKLATADLNRAEATGDEAARARGMAQLAEARRELQTALDLQPGESQALDSLAKLLGAIDRADGRDDPQARAEAEAAFRRAMAANRFSPKPVVGLADLYRRAGDLDRAAAVLRAIRPRAPRDTDVLLALAEVEQERGRADAARGLWRAVLTIDPDNDRARDGLATATG